MILNTSRFGDVEIEEDKIVSFPEGIPGFSDVKRYIILDHPNGPDVPFKCLHAVDDADLAFVITDPLLFNCDYNPDIDEQDLKELQITSPEDFGMIVIVTIPHDEPEKMTANLQGPILINLGTREAKQVFLVSDDCQIRYPLLQKEAVLR
ncbi:MAG: hypothetical protein A2Z47_04420 [Thermodesulfovibrio sp. RBG_19FT_COMBO_42_12]|nr:MAG: hypothetical protein A2Z47_04420 [Thermodesulfovibrio sp. RBG_19FT_COMBO_42_12]HZX48152.1 flagellar assembly protein FliW [Nitrospirota bacterium]